MARPPHRPQQAPLAGPSLKAETELIKRRQYAQAESRLATLRRQFPAHAGVLALHGDALRGLERYEEAVPAYQAAIKAGLDRTDVRLHLAACLINSKQAEQGLEIAEAVLAGKPDHAGALGLKCSAHRILNQPQLAREAGRRALALNPRDAKLLEVMAHLDTFTADSPVFDVIPKALEDKELPPQKQANLWSVLGKAHLDIDEPARAFEHYQRANEIMDGHLPPIKSELERLLTFTRQHFTPALFDALSPHGQQSRPQIIVAGMSRSGKSLVESLFRGVAGVKLMGEDPILGKYRDELVQGHDKNLGLWLADQTPSTVARDAAEYLRRLQALDDDSAIKVTTMPGDLWNLGLIGLWAPQVPIIFAVRDVLDLGVTGYFQQYEFPEGYRYSYDLHQIGRQIACFEKVMEHWAQVLPNPVYLVDYEALVAEPQTVMNNLLGDLALQREQAYEEVVGENAGMADAISPIVSMDAPMPITNKFVGFGAQFRDQLAPLIKGYHTIVDAFPRLEPPATLPVPLPDALVDTDSDQPNPSDTVTFDWQLQGRVVVVDQGGATLAWPQIKEWMALGSFSLVSFDAMGDAANDIDMPPDADFQHVRQVLLGDGEPTTLHVCLDATYSSTLAPLPAEQLPPWLQQKALVLAKLPLPTHRLDAVQGLERVDWLILDERHDSLAVLEHGSQVLQNTLLIQVGLSFSPLYQRQSSLAEIMHWAARHGFQFHRLVDMRHQQAMPERDDLPHQPDGTALERAAALLLPNAARMEAMDDTQRLRLAFVLDTVYGLHDVVYTLLKKIGGDLADNYLKARGYFDQRRGGPSCSQLTNVRHSLNQGGVFVQNRTVREWAQHYPKDAHVRRLLAETSSWMGRQGDAIHHIGRAMEWAPEDLGIRLSAVEILLRAGMWWEAEGYASQLLAREPQHPRVQQTAYHALATHPAPDAEAVQQALQAINALHAQTDTDTRPLLQSLHARLLSHAGQQEDAIAMHIQALEALNDIEGPQRAIALAAQADTQFAARKVDDSCYSLGNALETWPYSPHTVHAYRHLTQRLGQAESQTLQDLSKLHQRIREIWSGYKAENLKHSFGDFGLPYQGFEPLMLPGTRPAMRRLAIYQLERYLPKAAQALDIGCNHGFLLLGLAPHLAYGMGFDISQSCIDIGNAVAEHLGHSHIALSNKPFARFNTKKQFDLVIACAVHHWIGIPLEDFGAKLHRFCKAGGIVLLESQGIRRTDVTEEGFVEKAETIAAAGFEVVHKGSLCDDGINYREFWILRK